MLPAHDVDPEPSASDSSDRRSRGTLTDPARGPRGLVLAVALGIAVWVAAILIFLAFR
jgi:hypothetical protein